MENFPSIQTDRRDRKRPRLSAADASYRPCQSPLALRLSSAIEPTPVYLVMSKLMPTHILAAHPPPLWSKLRKLLIYANALTV